MNPIDQLFVQLRAGGQCAFMPFLTAGDPSLAFTGQALTVLAESGASMIEIGVSFSDPVADGPVIQASYTRALASGFKLNGLFELVRQITSQPAWVTPLVAMASYSLIFKRGIDKFVMDAKQAGFCGAIVPDLPVEEAGELSDAAKDLDFKLILLVTPTTSPERAERIVKVCSGFVYVVSVVGITGARESLPADLTAMIARLRGMTNLPLCVGFGVSTRKHVLELGKVADGVIVGSALVKLLEKPDALVELRRMTQLLIRGQTGSS